MCASVPFFYDPRPCATSLLFFKNRLTHSRTRRGIFDSIPPKRVNLDGRSSLQRGHRSNSGFLSFFFYNPFLAPRASTRMWLANKSRSPATRHLFVTIQTENGPPPGSPSAICPRRPNSFVPSPSANKIRMTLHRGPQAFTLHCLRGSASILVFNFYRLCGPPCFPSFFFHEYIFFCLTPPLPFCPSPHPPLPLAVRVFCFLLRRCISFPCFHS